MSNYPYPVSPSLVDEFDRRGFVVTPDVLSDAEIENYGRAVDQEVSNRSAHDQRSVEQKSLYEQSFVQCMRLWETNQDVLPLSCHAGLAGIATQLLQVSGVRMWQDQALYKQVGGRATTPHQDQTFWPIGAHPLVSAWIPFDDVSIDQGAMAYVPGSHKAGALQVVDITHTTQPYEIMDDPALKGAQAEYVEVQAGSVVWHHGFTVHEAAANTSNTTRRVFTVVYISDQARRVKGWSAYPLDRAQVAVGELIQGVGLPELWPPSQQLPTPPANVGVATGPQYTRN